MCIATTACSGDSGPVSAHAPVVNEGISDRDFEAALAVVEREFDGCRSLGIDVMGGSTVVRAGTAAKMARVDGRTLLTGQAVRSAPASIVVVLRGLDMFLVEPGPGPVPFSRTAVGMLRDARAARDGCGEVAGDRYAYTAPPSAS